MESLYYEETLETPEVILDKDKNKFKISGKSFPEEAKKFYDPILRWIDEYLKNPNDKTIFEFSFDYYNSASATQILEILYSLNELYKNGFDVKIIWSYFKEDDDMLDAGREYEEMIEVPFEIEAYTDQE